MPDLFARYTAACGQCGRTIQLRGDHEVLELLDGVALVCWPCAQLT